ncbi:MAG: hypothetical protein JWM56_1402 [Candidatus Peribacteria bacterium]|nr:hypothetical protein [Candidatus Peribacteria bacterium]
MISKAARGFLYSIGVLFLVGSVSFLGWNTQRTRCEVKATQYLAPMNIPESDFALGACVSSQVSLFSLQLNGQICEDHQAASVCQNGAELNSCAVNAFYPGKTCKEIFKFPHNDSLDKSSSVRQ